MIIEAIILVIFICSFGGVSLILIRKIPSLNSLPQNGISDIKKHQIVLNVENKIKEVSVFFEKQILLHRFLSWTKVMTLKIETKIDLLLHKIRKKAQQDKANKDKK